MTPSGPRRPGQGVEDEQQGVASASVTPTSGLLLKITLLAAGFVIGPSGSSVREICRFTGADVRSWTEPPAGPTSRPLRAFTVEGSPPRVAAAAAIILAAVDRYVTLTDGSCAGRTVGRAQEVAGMVFSYQPPPRAVVPHAAALKSGGSGGGGTRSPGLWGREPAPSPPPPPSAGESTTSQGLLKDLVAALQAHRSGGGGGGGQEAEGGPWPPARPASARSPPGFGRAGSSPAALPAALPQPYAHALHNTPPAPAPHWKAAKDAAAAAVTAHHTGGEADGGWANPASPAWTGLLAGGAGPHHEHPDRYAPTPTPTQRRGGAEGATPPSDPPPPWAAGGSGTTLAFSDGPPASVARRAAEDASQAAALAVALHNLEVLDLEGGSPPADGGGVRGGGGGGNHPSPHPPTRLSPPPGFEHLGPGHQPQHPHLGPITPGPGRAGRAASAPPPVQGGEAGAGVDNGTGPFWPGI